jgi:Starch binding domain
MEPLNWAQGEYITLLADIAAGQVIDIPPAVCSRYYACILTPGSGQVQVNINVKATTQYGQYMYVTGNTGTLGNWNTNLGIPVDLPGVEERDQPGRQQLLPVQVLPKEFRRQRHLGMLPGQRQLQRKQAVGHTVFRDCQS